MPDMTVEAADVLNSKGGYPKIAVGKRLHSGQTTVAVVEPDNVVHCDLRLSLDHTGKLHLAVDLDFFNSRRPHQLNMDVGFHP